MCMEKERGEGFLIPSPFFQQFQLFLLEQHAHSPFGK